MSELEQLSAPPVEAFYSLGSPSEIITLGEVDVEFEHRGVTYSETAKATMHFSPKVRLLLSIPGFRCSLEHALRDLTEQMWSGKLKLVGRGVTIDAFCTSVGQDGMVIAPTKSGFVATAPAPELTRATVHILNLAELRGPDDYVLLTGERPRQSAKRCARVILEADGWQICIAALRETKERLSTLKRLGGYAITHVASVSRADQSAFNSDQLSELLTCLHYFLSFACGRWAGVALPVGFDATGNLAFEEWGARLMADGPWDGSCSWWDVQHGELLKEVFPGFVALWKSELWNRALREALYWYLGANERGTGIGVDSGLILAQTALELLAWNYCVRDRRMVSEAAFKPRGLSAADKLRLLASTIGIPLEIPSTLTGLHSKPGKKWADGMEAVTTIRNTLVHPDAETAISDGSYYDAWRLSLLYIELAILRLCGHNGEYSDRLTCRTLGQVVTVPWATNVTNAERDNRGN